MSFSYIFYKLKRKNSDRYPLMPLYVFLKTFRSEERGLYLTLKSAFLRRQNYFLQDLSVIAASIFISIRWASAELFCKLKQNNFDFHLVMLLNVCFKNVCWTERDLCLTLKSPFLKRQNYSLQDLYVGSMTS